MPRGLRAGSFWTRLLRVVASFVVKTRPECTCPRRASASKYAHAAGCPRFLHLRIVALLQRHGLEPYDDAALVKTLELLEAGRGTAGGADTSWRGGGTDPIVEAYLKLEIHKAQERAARARETRSPATAHDSRVKALKNVRTALRRYAGSGTMIVDLSQLPEDPAA